jgi:uncharacterized membrane protein
MSPSRSLAVSLALALAVPAQAAQSSAPAPVRFRVVVLGTHGLSSNLGNEEATCINSKGETAGTVLVAGSAHAAHWSVDGKLTDLGTTGGCTYSWASGISDAGAVVGISSQLAPDNSFLWTQAGGTHPLALPSKCYPAAILDDGTIAFTAFLGLFPIGSLWKPGVSNQRIVAAGGEVYVRDLSPSGSVSGLTTKPGSPNRAFRWTPHLGLVPLDPPAGYTDCVGYGTNDDGGVAGVSTAPGVDQPSFWDASGAGFALPFARSTSVQGTAFAINTKGWVVGYEFEAVTGRPFGVLWIDGVAYELTDLLALPPGAPPMHVRIGWDVNENGQLAVRGVVAGVERALRLDPL